MTLKDKIKLFSGEIKFNHNNINNNKIIPGKLKIPEIFQIENDINNDKKGKKEDKNKEKKKEKNIKLNNIKIENGIKEV